MLGYFVWYPWQLARKGFRLPLQDTQIPPDRLQRMDLNRIKSAGEIFADVFIWYKQHLQHIGGTALVMSSLYCLLAFPFANELPANVFEYQAQLFGGVFQIDQFFVNVEAPLLPFVNILVLSIGVVAIYGRMKRYLGTEETPIVALTIGQLLSYFLKAAIISGGLVLLLASNAWYTFFLFMLFSPMILVWAFVMYQENLGPLLALQRSLQLINGNLGRLIGLFALLLSISLLFFMIMDSSFVWFYFELISWNLPFEQAVLDQIGAVIITFVNVFVLSLMFSFILIGIGLLYFSLIEIKEAPGLLDKIRLIGLGKQIQGIDKEN